MRPSRKESEYLLTHGLTHVSVQPLSEVAPRLETLDHVVDGAFRGAERQGTVRLPDIQHAAKGIELARVGDLEVCLFDLRDCKLLRLAQTKELVIAHVPAHDIKDGPGAWSRRRGR